MHFKVFLPMALCMLMTAFPGCQHPQTKGVDESVAAAGKMESTKPPSAPASQGSSKSGDALLAQGNALLKQIHAEAGEVHAPVFLYRSEKYRSVINDICGFKETLFAVAADRALNEDEFLIVWQALEHLPIDAYIEWMSLWALKFKADTIDYERLTRVLFPMIEENSEYYYHFTDRELSAFYTMLREDTEFMAELNQDNSFEKYGKQFDEKTFFLDQVDHFLTGKKWAYIKGEVMACQFPPSHGPLQKRCPTDGVREKEKPPKWWKMMCDKPFGITPKPDEYWDGKGADAPWWEKLPAMYQIRHTR